MSDEFDKVSKIKYHYRFDAFLMYLVQDVTKRPSAEILNFFNELTVQVAEIGFKNKKEHQRSIHKKIDDYFPGTSIPFHLELKGLTIRPHVDWTTKAERPGYLQAEVSIGFPDRATYIKEDVLKEIEVALMEKALLGGEDINIPPFEKPPQSSGKMFKQLMDSFAGREPEPKKPRKKKIKTVECSHCGYDTCKGCSAGGC